MFGRPLHSTRISETRRVRLSWLEEAVFVDLKVWLRSVPATACEMTTCLAKPSTPTTHYSLLRISTHEDSVFLPASIVSRRANYWTLVLSGLPSRLVFMTIRDRDADDVSSGPSEKLNRV